MSSIPLSRYNEALEQALALQEAGCEVLRFTVPDRASAEALGRMRGRVSMPLVADIHFDYRLALAALDAGADKIRINPGNMNPIHLKEIADLAQKTGAAIRVGVNAGSLEKDLLARYGGASASALAESALRNVARMEALGFTRLVVSMKSSDVRTMVDAYRQFAKVSPYPLHLGVTEAGTLRAGTIKSAVGIGALLLDGIGDTVRVSLTANPLEEIETAKLLLRALGLYACGVEVISCPTCGRTTVNTEELALQIEEEFKEIRAHVKVAVMGCIVNGPGEAKMADIGVTGANGEYILFRGDTIQHHIPQTEILPRLRTEINDIISQKSKTIPPAHPAPVNPADR